MPTRHLLLLLAMWAGHAPGHAVELANTQCVAAAKAGGGFDLTCKLAQAGLLEGKYIPAPMHISYLPALRGLIALQQGTLAEALQKLEPALSNEFALPGTAFFASFGSLYPAYVRGQTYLAANRPADAAVEFQKIISRRGLVMEDPIDAVARLQRARALVASGDTARARVAYQDFLTLWKQADTDVPLLKQAQAEAAKLR